MKKLMNISAPLFLLLAIVASILYYSTQAEIFLTLAITFGTFAYHFIMRLGVGFVFQHVMHTRYNYKNRWFSVSKAEQNLYKKLKVKTWKNNLATYYPDDFNPKLHSWKEIAQTMCRSELIHEVNMLLSFLPIFAGDWFDAYPVFIITSILAAIFDLCFVIIQRYNRPRVLKLLA